MKNRLGFTLSELLIGLAIVGALAALAIPNVVETMNRKILVSQVKNTIVGIQNVIDSQMIENNTRDLLNTKFATPSEILSSSYFEIAKSCSTASECWGGITYRHLGNTSTTAMTTSFTNTCESVKTAMLKNGVLISYCKLKAGKTSSAKPGEAGLAVVYIDANGADKPNITGRDFFNFYITRSGKIVDNDWLAGRNFTEEQLITSCRGGNVPSSCVTLLMRHAWNMTY